MSESELLSVVQRVAKRFRHDDALGLAWELGVGVVKEITDPEEVEKRLAVRLSQSLSNVRKRDKVRECGVIPRNTTTEDPEPHNVAELIALAPDWLETRVVRARAAGYSWREVRDEFYPGRCVKKVEREVKGWLKDIAAVLS